MASKDFCISGTRKLDDDCQQCLLAVQDVTGRAIEAAIKANAGADPVSELVIRRLLDQLQAAHSTAVQLQSARNAAFLNSN